MLISNWLRGVQLSYLLCNFIIYLYGVLQCNSKGIIANSRGAGSKLCEIRTKASKVWLKENKNHFANRSTKLQSLISNLQHSHRWVLYQITHVVNSTSRIINHSWREHKRNTYLINICKSDENIALIYINFKFNFRTKYYSFLWYYERNLLSRYFVSTIRHSHRICICFTTAGLSDSLL